MQIILLEKIEKLGSLGEEVRVKNGYARNFLLPQRKALRETYANRAYFEREKVSLEAANATKRDAAAKEAKKLEKLDVTLIRQASEAGHLYGSVMARDIAEIVTEATKVDVNRNHVELNSNLKQLGLFQITIALHPEVKVEVTVNIARTLEEAKIQQKTGKAVVQNDEQPAKPAKVETQEAAPEASEETAQDSEANADEAAA